MFGLLTIAAASTLGWETGNSLLRECNDQYLVAVCDGYISGVADTMSGAGVVCVPAGVERGQAIAVVIKYLRENPATLQKPAAQLAAGALGVAFPCGK